MTSILCRVDLQNSPVVFIADTLQSGRLAAWDGGKGTKEVGIDYYQSTQPLSDADAEVLRKKYAKATGQPPETVFVRQRLPRVYRQRPNILAPAGASNAPQEAMQQGSKPPSRSEIARAQYEADKRATDAAAGAAAMPPDVAALQKQMEDPRFRALVYKVADILKTAL